MGGVTLVGVGEMYNTIIPAALLGCSWGWGLIRWRREACINMGVNCRVGQENLEGKGKRGCSAEL
jgi:hypothetical protein